jgi:hypothetical protein
MNKRLPTSQFNVEGIIPKRVIYVNALYLNRSPIYANYSWYLDIAQGNYYSNAAKNTNYAVYHELSIPRAVRFV